jgi:hypothetical protein
MCGKCHETNDQQADANSMGIAGSADSKWHTDGANSDYARDEGEDGFANVEFLLLLNIINFLEIVFILSYLLHLETILCHN